eukprot:scaffold42298_cov30-Phaeocystis_antarctica.AAC.1
MQVGLGLEHAALPARPRSLTPILPPPLPPTLTLTCAASIPRSRWRRSGVTESNVGRTWLGLGLGLGLGVGGRG